MTTLTCGHCGRPLDAPPCTCPDSTIAALQAEVEELRAANLELAEKNARQAEVISHLPVSGNHWPIYPGARVCRNGETFWVASVGKRLIEDEAGFWEEARECELIQE